MARRPDATTRASAYCVAVTCFAKTGALDDEANHALFDRVASAGVGLYVGSASPGEGHALSPSETERLYRSAVDAAAGRVPARAMGCELRSAGELLDLVRIATDIGMDAMQVYSLDLGHANHPTPPEQERYFRTILEAMTIPAVISSHVANGWVPSVDLLGRLVDDYPHLVGLNVTNPDLAYVVRVLERSAGRVEVHVGGPMQAVTILALGGHGFLCTEAAIAPRLVAAVVDAHHAGHLAARDEAYATLMRLFALNRFGASVRFTKAVLRLQDHAGYHFRPPYLPHDDVTQRAIADALVGWHLA